jgi:hypothetical protein
LATPRRATTQLPPTPATRWGVPNDPEADSSTGDLSASRRRAFDCYSNYGYWTSVGSAIIWRVTIADMSADVQITASRPVNLWEGTNGAHRYPNSD